MRRKLHFSNAACFIALTIGQAAASAPNHCSTSRDAPWVISNGCGESYLPDIFYAENIQNEQVMPLQLADKHVREAKLRPRLQIDRLIYPTLGNPNLYIKADAGDALKLVLRLEWSLLEALSPTEPSRPENGAEDPTATQPKFFVRFASEDVAQQTGLRAFLVERANRSKLVRPQPLKNDPTANIFEIRPSRILQHSQSGYPKEPKEIRQRYTMELDFNQAAMASVPPGFYDVRFEVDVAGVTKVYEYHYNAVRVFADAADHYSYVNVTDSQLSVSRFGENTPGIGKSFASETQDRLGNFVSYIQRVMKAPNSGTLGDVEDQIRRSAFISFNGDLHNGGAPAPTDFYPESVAWNYQKEAERIIDILMELELPIFLTTGNHDGYVAMGHVPSAVALMARVAGEKAMDEVVADVEAAYPVEKAGIRQRFAKFIEETKEDFLGGRKNDTTTGAFVRLDAQGWTKPIARLLATYDTLPADEDGHLRYRNHTSPTEKNVETWQFLPENVRNLPLYDGFNTWRKTYGPLHMSWRFGQNVYLNLNSYDCHQHRRSGYGMFTVNYGGCVSGPQMLWLNNQVESAKRANLDMVLIAHHDPRGGHNGKAYPFYFEQIDYTGVFVSIKNYAVGSIIRSKACPILNAINPQGAFANSQKIDCYNDGLQEWMLPDPDFGCKDEEKNLENGQCNKALFSDELPQGVRRNHRYTGYELIHLATNTWGMRTLLLGHTHYHSVEVLTPGDSLVPDEVVLSSDNHKSYSEIFTANEASIPMRLLSRVWKKLTKNDQGEVDEQDAQRIIDEYRALGIEKANLRNMEVTKLLFGAGSKHTFDHKITRDKELAILRMTSISTLTSQTVAGSGASSYGFVVFEVNDTHNRAGYTNPTLSEITYIRAAGDKLAPAVFEQIGMPVSLDRNTDAAIKIGPDEGYFDYSK